MARGRSDSEQGFFLNLTFVTLRDSHSQLNRSVTIPDSPIQKSIYKKVRVSPSSSSPTHFPSYTQLQSQSWSFPQSPSSSSTSSDDYLCVSPQVLIQHTLPLSEPSTKSAPPSSPSSKNTPSTNAHSPSPRSQSESSNSASYGRTIRAKSKLTVAIVFRCVQCRLFDLWFGSQSFLDRPTTRERHMLTFLDGSSFYHACSSYSARCWNLTFLSSFGRGDMLPFLDALYPHMFSRRRIINDPPLPNSHPSPHSLLPCVPLHVLSRHPSLPHALLLGTSSNSYLTVQLCYRPL